MVNIENIPLELKEYPHWVGWGVELRDGKETKIPYSPHGGLASVDDPSTWGTFEQAISYLERNPNLSGLGFVFADDDPFCGIDLDKCRDPQTGVVDTDAQKIIEDFGSYTEISPSGKGVHIILKGKKMGGKCRSGKIEIYDTERYFTFTGNVLNEHRTIELRQEQLDLLYNSLFAKEEKQGATKQPQAVSLDDQTLIEKAKNAKDGAKFTALWEGDLSGYDSQSEADLALCSMLAFWTGGDPDRIDRLFRQSGLYREKWHREDYRDMTISRAIENTTEFYNPNRIDVINSQSDSVADAQFETTFTEGWLARKFVELHGQDVRYCYVWDKWLIWTGKRWKVDHTGEVYRKAKGVVKSLLKEAGETDDDKTRKLLAQFAYKADTRAKYSAMLELAKCELPVLPEDLDADPMLLNVNNGTINLRTGKLLTHRRDDFITKLAPVDYIPDASCGGWLSFLGRIMNNNANLLEFLQRAIGYALTGDIGEQTLFFLYGTGANGKTVFLESIKGMLGDYAKEAEPEILIQKYNNTHPTGVADLMGARFVSTTEVGEGRRMNEVRVKQLTGGDRLKARFMRQDFFEFYPTHKIFLAANHKPIIRGTDLAIWRRIRLVPFEVTIPEHERIPLAKMLAMLKSEWSGILVWAVQGCLAWQEHGLGVPLEVERATQAYRDEMDIIGDFLEVCCIIDPNVKAKASGLYATYKAWCDTNGEHSLSQKVFGSRLSERGFERKREKTGYFWLGIGIIENEVNDPNNGSPHGEDRRSKIPGENECELVNHDEPFSGINTTVLISSRLIPENGSPSFTQRVNNAPEANDDKGLSAVNDRSSQAVEHKGGLSKKLDEYLTKCSDNWVSKIQDGIKQNKFPLSRAVEASRRMSNGDSQGAWRLLRQNGG